MKINFKLQTIISVILIVIGFALSLYFAKDIFYNLAWSFAGLAFLINPVYPQNMVRLEQKDAEKAIRIAGAVLIFIGITNGFGV